MQPHFAMSIFFKHLELPTVMGKPRGLFKKLKSKKMT